MTSKALKLALAASVMLTLGSGCASTLDWGDEQMKKVSEKTGKAKKNVQEWTSTAVEEAKDLGPDDLVRVKPWERDVLARPEMSFSPSPHLGARRNHIYFSKEASLGGGSAGGGGCGCN